MLKALILEITEGVKGALFYEERDERLIKIDMYQRSSVAEKWDVVDDPGWDRFEKKFRLKNTNFCL
ncbi:MAG: hypothetical protein HY279_14575 [Nitrospinae bacterium]|nr:hypothetical protein [Nitrospinota bacterium]